MFLKGDRNSNSQIISSLPQKEWLLLSHEAREFLYKVEVERENKGLKHGSITFSID